MQQVDQPKAKLANMGIYVISWHGQHANAVAIADELAASFEHVAIVYSDPAPDLALVADCDVIVRPNHLFWADKFHACITHCETEMMLVVHADCSCPDWTGLATKMHRTMAERRDIWVLAPLIQGASYELEATRIGPLSGTTLEVVAETDGIIFGLARPAIERMRRVDYTKNLLGWGISAMFCAFAFHSQKLVVVDTSVRATHPKARGYDSSNAWGQRTEFLRQLTLQEAILANLLRFYVSQRQGRKA